MPTDVKQRQPRVSDVAELISFGPFLMDTRRRALLAGGKPVAMHARTFDLLDFLIANRDRVVSRDEIVTHVWRGMAVGENNLNVQLSTLRRSLAEQGADGLIVTLAGRGYRFVGDIDVPPLPEMRAAVAPPAIPAAPGPGVGPEHSHPQYRIFMAAFMLAMACLVLWVLSRPGRSPDTTRDVPQRLSIVVMPFRNLSGDSARDDLADAITDDLTTDLSHLPGSLVIARTSADSYKGKQVPADQIGRELHVHYVLEGSIRAVLGKLRVNAQLIDTGTGAHVWAQYYDREMDHPWDAQDDIVHHIDSALGIALVQDVVARAPRDRPGQPDALDLYFHARSILDHGDTLEQMTQAQHLLERVRAAAPDSTDALTALGWLLVRKVQTYDYPGYVQDSEDADTVTARALALAPNNPAALAGRARFLIYKGRFAEAEPGLEAALAIDPNNLQALQSKAVWAWKSGQPEKVIAPEKRLLQVDPVGPASTGRYQLLGMAALFAGHTADAVRYLRLAEGDLQPPPSVADRVTPIENTKLYLIAATSLAGDPAEAKRRYQAFHVIWPRRTAWREMAFFNAAQAHMANFVQVGDALQAAGMPRFADEHADEHVAPTASPLAGSDFTPTPTSIPGATAIDTAGLLHLLGNTPAPILVDVGRFCAAPMGAIPLSDAEAARARDGLDKTAFGLRADAEPGAPIVVVGTSSSGVNSYNTALHLLAAGYRTLYWYRGGEEAWASAALPAQERH